MRMCLSQTGGRSRSPKRGSSSILTAAHGFVWGRIRGHGNEIHPLPAVPDLPGGGTRSGISQGGGHGHRVRVEHQAVYAGHASICQGSAGDALALLSPGRLGTREG